MKDTCKQAIFRTRYQAEHRAGDLEERELEFFNKTYPSVHLTSPQQWDPSVLDYVHPKDNAEPNSTYNSTKKFQVDPIFDEFNDCIDKILFTTPQI